MVIAKAWDNGEFTREEAHKIYEAAHLAEELDKLELDLYDPEKIKKEE